MKPSFHIILAICFIGKTLCQISENEDLRTKLICEEYELSQHSKADFAKIHLAKTKACVSLSKRQKRSAPHNTFFNNVLEMVSDFQKEISDALQGFSDEQKDLHVASQNSVNDNKLKCEKPEQRIKINQALLTNKDHDEKCAPLSKEFELKNSDTLQKLDDSQCFEKNETSQRLALLCNDQTECDIRIAILFYDLCQCAKMRQLQIDYTCLEANVSSIKSTKHEITKRSLYYQNHPKEMRDRERRRDRILDFYGDLNRPPRNRHHDQSRNKRKSQKRGMSNRDYQQKKTTYRNKQYRQNNNKRIKPARDLNDYKIKSKRFGYDLVPYEEERPNDNYRYRYRPSTDRVAGYEVDSDDFPYAYKPYASSRNVLRTPKRNGYYKTMSLSENSKDQDSGEAM